MTFLFFKKQRERLIFILFLAVFGLFFLKGIPMAEEIKPGIVITRDNCGKYLSELKRMLPPGMHDWCMEIGLKKGFITMPIVEPHYFPEWPRLIKATENGRGKCKIGPNNDLLGWESGYPFPDPQTALELAWDVYPEISRANSPDDLSLSNYWYYYSKDKKEKKLSMYLQRKKYMGRTIPPMPSMPEAKKTGVLSKESIVIREPFDVKGFIQMRIRYWKIDKLDDVYSYIPVMRRLRRLTGNDLCDPMLGSDSVFDDYEVWRQKLNPKMTFRIIDKGDFLVPSIYTEHPPRDSFIKGPCFQHNWEIKPLVVLEIKLNDPDYPYSKRVIYIDKKGGFKIYWGDQYDQKGRLWRANGGAALCEEVSRDQGPVRQFYGWIYLNCLTRHFSTMDFYPSWEILDSAKAFTVKGLMKMAR